jgi:DNA gyrase/topoisomerase IV subunit A
MREEMEFMKLNYNESLQDVKDNYENELKSKERQYKKQLSVYTSQLENLMMEMNRIKGQYSESREVEIIHEEDEEEEEHEYDEERVKRDLMMHVVDSSDYFVSPPSTTPIKTFD